VDRFDLVIFDCDGVLVDSERLIIDVEIEMMAEQGLALSREDVIREFVGLSDEAMRARVAELSGSPLPTDWEIDYARRCQRVLAEEVLDHLDRVGIPTCIASSGSHDKMAMTLGKTGLRDRFGGRIFSSTDPEVARGKPAPDLFLHAAARMDIAPARCAVIEDSPFGVAAALAAGMTAFGFAGGVVSEARLIGDGATDGVVVFHAMAELVGLLDSGPPGRG